MKNKGHTEVREYADTRSCNCCSKSNYQDNARIYEVGVYNYLNQGTCVALCEDCLYNLIVKAQEVLNNA